jgi:hypothetical protein
MVCFGTQQSRTSETLVASENEGCQYDKDDEFSLYFLLSACFGSAVVSFLLGVGYILWRERSRAFTVSRKWPSTNKAANTHGIEATVFGETSSIALLAEELS